MSDRQAQRHAAAMLVHQIGSGIEALGEFSQELAIENAESLHQSFLALGYFLIRMGDIESKKNEMFRSHQ